MSAPCEPAMWDNQSASVRGVKREPYPPVTESTSGPVCNRSSDAKPKLLRFQSYQVLQLDRNSKTHSYIDPTPKDNLIAIVGSSEAGRTRGKNQKHKAPHCNLPVAKEHHLALIDGKVRINNVDLANGRIDLTRRKKVKAVIVTNTKYENAEECGKHVRLTFASYDANTPEVAVPPVRDTGNKFMDAMTVCSAKPVELPDSLSQLGRYQYHITLCINARTHNEISRKNHEPFMFTFDPEVAPIRCQRPQAGHVHHQAFNSFTVVKKREMVLEFEDRMNVLVTSSETSRQRNTNGVGAHSQYKAKPSLLPRSDPEHHLAIIETNALVRNHSVEEKRIEIRRDVTMTLAILCDIVYEDPQELGARLRLMFARCKTVDEEVEVPDFRTSRDSYTPPLTVKPCNPKRKILIPGSVRSRASQVYCFDITIQPRTYNELAGPGHEPFTFALACPGPDEDDNSNIGEVLVNDGHNMEVIDNVSDGPARLATSPALDFASFDIDVIWQELTNPAAPPNTGEVLVDDITRRPPGDVDNLFRVMGQRPAPTHGQDGDDDDGITESVGLWPGTESRDPMLFKSEGEYFLNPLSDFNVKKELMSPKCRLSNRTPPLPYQEEEHDDDVGPEEMENEQAGSEGGSPVIFASRHPDDMITDSQEAYLVDRAMLAGPTDGQFQWSG